MAEARSLLGEDRRKLILAREILEESREVREKKETYEEVKNQRARLAPGDYDSAGYTLLHWAVMYGDEKEVQAVLRQDAKNINSESEKYRGVDVIRNRVYSCQIWDMTALYIAAWHGKASIVQALLNQGADPHIRPMYAMSMLSGPLTQQEHVIHQQAPLAFDHANDLRHYEVVNLLAPSRAAKYKADRAADKSEHKTSFSCFCTTFNYGYSRGQKLAAADAFIALLADNNRKNNLAELEALAKTHPAMNQSELGGVYQAVLNAAKILAPKWKGSNADIRQVHS